MKYDILLGSAFGRGHWLAAELAERELSVLLVDMTKIMGRWSPEDIEGPFGLFSDSLTTLQRERLIEEDYIDSIENGFTIWLKDGPLDMKGPNFSYRFQMGGYPESLKEYLYKSDPDKEEAEKIKEMPFEKNWLAHFCHQLSSNTFKNNHQGMEFNTPLPLMSHYSVRRVSRRGYQKNCDWLRSKGVHLCEPLGVEHVDVSQRECRGWYLRGLTDGKEGTTTGKGVEETVTAFRADQFIWCLSSEESQVFTPKIHKTLFPKGSVSPQWYWLRYRVQLASNAWLQSLPIKFVILEDIYRSWTHTNLCLVQKTSRECTYDVWVRPPQSYRSQRSSLEKISRNILDLLQKKIPNAAPQLLDMPQEYHHTEEHLGPGLLPVYEDLSLKRLTRASLKNFYFDGPETWSSLDWLGRFKGQNEILLKVQQFHKKASQKKQAHSKRPYRQWFRENHPNTLGKSHRSLMK